MGPSEREYLRELTMYSISRLEKVSTWLAVRFSVPRLLGVLFRIIGAASPAAGKRESAPRYGRYLLPQTALQTPVLLACAVAVT